MPHFPLLNERDLRLLVAYSHSNEELSVAVVEAFHAANVDVFEKPTKLADWVNTDVFDDLQWSADRPLYFSTRIWGCQVVITAEEVRIYTQAGSP